MLRTGLALTLSLAACAATTPMPHPTDPNALARDRNALHRSVADVRALLTQYAAEHPQVPALAVAIVRGAAVETLGVGHSRDGAGPPDGATLFEIGSITKVFTSLLLADLVVHGDVALDTPVAALLPTVRVPDREGRAITLEHLATHSAGLPRLPPGFAPHDLADPYADFDASRLDAALAHTTLATAPGATYAYSNFGAAVLGQALARRVGVAFETALAQRVTGPLGLRDTACTLAPAQRARMAAGHDATGHAVPDWTFSAVAPAGALHSSVSDLARFAQAQLAPHGPLADAIRLSQIPRAYAGETGGSIALGWHVIDQGRVLFHNGQTGGFHGVIVVDRGADVAVVILANAGEESVDALGMRVLRNLRGEPERPPPPPAAVVTVAPEQMDALTGTYALAPTFHLVVRRTSAGLEVQATHQPAVALRALSPTEWATVGVDARLSFELGAEGHATRVVLHQNGHDMPGLLEPASP